MSRIRSCPSAASADGLLDQIKAVRDDRETQRLPAPAIDLARQDQRVEFDDIAGLHRLPNRHQLAASRQDGYTRPAGHLQLHVPAGRHRAQVYRAQGVPGWQHQLRFDNILAQRANMGPGGDRRADANAVRAARFGGWTTILVQRLDIFHRDDGIRPFGQRIAGIQIGGSLFSRRTSSQNRVTGALGIAPWVAAERTAKPSIAEAW